MVCAKCEKKLSKVAPPEKWKDGAGERKINENKALSTKKRWAPYSSTCNTCKSKVAAEYSYCQSCAYIKGLCAMCGKKVMDTKGYKQSTT